jgi:hypothetical protein
MLGFLPRIIPKVPVIGDEGNLKSNDKEKPRPLGQGYTGFTQYSTFPLFHYSFFS